MDGGGIAETGRGTDVVGGQPDRAVAAGVPHTQVTAPVDAGDGPAVAVLDPVGGGKPESAVVTSSDDHISDTGPVSIGQSHLGHSRGLTETMRPGTAVDFGDQVAGGGDHDRVEPSRSVGNPSVERILNCGGDVADMDPAVSEVEVERPRVAVADGERGRSFTRVGEAVQLTQAQRAVGVADVAQHTAGADRGELLIIPDQPDTRTSIESEFDGGLEGQGVGHAGVVDDQQG